MIRIALPNKGALSDEAALLVKEAGYKARRTAKELSVMDSANEVEFIFLRPRDISIYVANGLIDLGITGRDLLLDSQADAREILPLGFGKSRFFYAVPASSDLSVPDLDGKRIATSYPNIVKADMARRGCHCSVTKLDGAVEISIRLGVADAIADVVESGTTMRQEGLKPIGEPVMTSEAIVVARDLDCGNNPRIHTFLRRLRGILTARNYQIIEYDIPRSLLERACAITPGLESPTISPLSKEDWVAVKAMAVRSQVNDAIDSLEELGATGIMVTDIRTCRM